MKTKRAVYILLISTLFISANCFGQGGTPGPQMQSPNSPEAQPGQNTIAKVVFHVDWEQEEVLSLALTNMKNLQAAIPPEKTSIYLVANGKAVNLFRKDKSADYFKSIDELHKKGVHFLMCRNAMAHNKIDQKDLLDVCEVVPAGIVELIRLQQEGYAYVKP
jgi:uncharacterized protein